MATPISATELRQLALNYLAETNPELKSSAVSSLALAWQQGTISLDRHAKLRASVTIPGHPAKPALIAPLLVKRRAMNTVQGRAALIHALAHIEFNAINLALDAIWRFSDMPEQYYADWLKVANEETYHFNLLKDHLHALGFHYGDFDAHNSLWEMVDKTKGDVLARMALVPRTMEARGLDALPALRAKLAQAGDLLAAEILDITLRDEVGHVLIGNYWFNFLCAQQGLAPLTAFEQLCRQYVAPKLRGPFNLEARRAAGFTEAELSRLEAVAAPAIKSSVNK
ncbi:MAG: ferritin-like domain-containing protein [Methylotenera sp.]|nr:ferritin-like domain-containing protein [Methylotenera sp.]MSQ00005.1 ferritin-like domain-containing protein [Methylotenera sp.]